MPRQSLTNYGTHSIYVTFQYYSIPYVKINILSQKNDKHSFTLYTIISTSTLLLDTHKYTPSTLTILPPLYILTPH